MSKLKLSIMSATPEPPQALASALQEFEAQSGIQVQIQTLPWETAWAELVKVALYKTGPDVSEVGNTWIESFIAMDALRPFLDSETATMGGPDAFLPSSWKSGFTLGGRQMWAIPWMSDTRVIYYRRDLLQQAGIDEQTAFQTPEQLARTLQRLQESGVAIPWVMPTAQTLPTLHAVTSWVWGAGGHFTSADGKRVVFDEPKALAGMYAYFSLHRYLAPAARNLNDYQANALFREGKAAALLSGPWVLNSIQQQAAAAEVIEHLGTAFVPGVPYVGGSNFIIWKHSRRVREALELLHFLTSYQVQTTYVPQAGLLPARLEALALPPFTTEPPYQVISESLKKGRGIQAVYMWGLIEDGLTAMLNKLWKALFADPGLDLEQVVAEHMRTLAHSLNRTLFESYQET
ncbi:MAG: extracellular solute-binding protein [Anaerolineae bacterium]|nr:extracellular solute-binding protein [Anaerolineae bacterium]